MSSVGFVPEGKVWVRIHGLYKDDLFEVDESTPEQEVLDARSKFKEAYPTQCVFISAQRITHTQSQGDAGGS